MLIIKIKIYKPIKNNKKKKNSDDLEYRNNQLCRFHPQFFFLLLPLFTEDCHRSTLQDAILEIFYLHHLHLLLLRIYGMPAFLSMFLSRACTEDQFMQRPPRRLRISCPLSLFHCIDAVFILPLASFQLHHIQHTDIVRAYTYLPFLFFHTLFFLTRNIM